MALYMVNVNAKMLMDFSDNYIYNYRLVYDSEHGLYCHV